MPSPSRPAAVILDIDGTLVDSNDAHARAWVEAFAEAGVHVEYNRVRRAIGMGGDKLMPHVSGIREDSPQGARISERRAEIFKTRYLPGLQPFAGVRNLVQRFVDDGLAIAVASSAKEDELSPLLERAGVADLIDIHTSSDDAENSKPDPDIVQMALKRCGAPREAVLMLGDTPYDVEAALRSGIGIVAVECGGWSRNELRGAAAVYASAAQLHERYEESPFARLMARARTAAAPAHGARIDMSVVALIAGGVASIALAGLMIRAIARSGGGGHRQDDAAGGRGRLSARELRRLQRLIERTS